MNHLMRDLTVKASGDLDKCAPARCNLWCPSSTISLLFNTSRGYFKAQDSFVCPSLEMCYCWDLMVETREEAECATMHRTAP